MTKHSYAEAASLAVIACLTLWAYWGVLRAPFHFDDSLFLDSAQISTPGDPLRVISPGLTRQLTYLTFYLNYRLGGTNPAGYHLVNLILHLGNVLLVYLFVQLTIEGEPDTARITVQRLLPPAAAGIFALHPVQSEPVNYIYQRSVLLAGFFSLVSLTICLWSGKAPKRRRYLWLAGVSWLLAAASKESAWVLPLVFAAQIWAHTPDLRSFGKSLLRFPFPAALTAAMMLSGIGWVYYNLHHSADRTIGSFLTSSSWRYLLSQVQVFATYLRLLVWPAGLTVDHDFKAAPFLSPYGLYCLGLLLGLLWLTIRARRARPTAAFLAASFFIFLAPTSSILPSADLLFEHRLYLPMIAASALLAWGILSVCSILFRQEKKLGAVFLVFLGFVLGGYAVLSRERTYVWGDDVRLWKDAVTKAPGKARAHYNLAVAYLGQSREDARKEFSRVGSHTPYYANALYNIGWIDQSAGHFDGARKYYSAALEADPEIWRARQNLGNLDVLEGKFEDAITEYQETIRINPDYWPAYQSLASLQLRQGRAAESLAALEWLKTHYPDLLEARYLNAFALIQSRKFAEADSELHWIEARDTERRYAPRIEELRRQVQMMSLKE